MKLYPAVDDLVRPVSRVAMPRARGCSFATPTDRLVVLGWLEQGQ